ncbi:stage III sporulation protein AF [Cohnella sp. JJ-181]|uniref:stage III sporulation protein AF n=1 Tax=Cohnella rhizoplanae TaxID=2974897 RepID=UPI0022FFBCF0|nr:stage III sporulation protein AF [Cohnella sp. JJ-181]CAI6055402.1 hypothetical protein COHCIP112018_01652 [Cohnella sp. JJ-181]
MEALGGWLRQVVAAVLLAALIDLLLPNRTMQRYVRLVAGLFILLTLAAPLLTWIQGDMDAKLAAGIEWAEREPGMEEDEGELAWIMAEAKRIGDGRNDQAAELAATGLEAQIRSAVEQEEGVTVDGVDVQAAWSADGTLEVGAVTVRLKPSGRAERTADASDAPIAAVDPVEPVTVDIDVGEARGPDGPAVRADAEVDGEPDAVDEAAAARAGRIAALIAGRFGIATARIDVVPAGRQGG